MPSNGVLPGWYPDPEGKPSERYWDGESWSEQTRPFPYLQNRPAPQSPKNVGMDSTEKGILVGVIVLIVLLALAGTGM
jgi:hypothetical protein